MYTKFKVLILLSLIILSACSGPYLSTRMQLESIESFESISFPFAFVGSKGLYEPRSGAIVLMQRDKQQVSILRDNKLINSFGGLGPGADQFLRLSDIALDPDGSILCLDSRAAKIKKFGIDGAYLGEVDLPGSLRPELLAVDRDFTMYVYDSTQNEIICYDALSMEEVFHFGRFALADIANLSCSRNYLVAYDSENKRSHIFNSLGESLKTVDGMWAYDQWGNSFAWHNFSFTAYPLGSLETDLVFIMPSFDPTHISIRGDYLLLGSYQGGILYKLKYRSSRD